MTMSAVCASRSTGKERDAESGLDHFHFRSYESSMGRWTSPDPGWFLAADLANPQSWNHYAYVTNNPLTIVDPLGLCGGALPTASSKLGDVVNAIGSFFCKLFGGGGKRNGGSTAGTGGGESGSSGGLWVPSGPAFTGGFLYPIESQIIKNRGNTVLENTWQLQTADGRKMNLKYGVREYIKGFDPKNGNNNADGTHSDTDAAVFISTANQFGPDTLGCTSTIFSCENGAFTQRFTLTILPGFPGAGTEVPVLVKVGGKIWDTLHWKNNGHNPTSSLDFPGPTLPVSPEGRP